MELASHHHHHTVGAGGKLVNSGAAVPTPSSSSSSVSSSSSTSKSALSPRNNEDQRLLRTVDSASSMNSTVYEEDEQLHRPGSAPPNLNFESSNFFAFGNSHTFFSNMKYDDELASGEFPEEMSSPTGNNDILPAHTISPTNQVTHDQHSGPTAVSQGFQAQRRYTSNIVDTKSSHRQSGMPNHRKNSIEMFLSQSPSQSLGGDFLKLSLDDHKMSLQANERGAGASSSAFASGHFTLNPVPESPKKYGRANLGLRPPQHQERYGAADLQQPVMSRSSSTSSYTNYQLSPRMGSEDSWHGSQDGGQREPSSYYQDHSGQDYYGGQQSQYGNMSREQQYHNQRQDHGMYRSSNQSSYGGGYANNGRNQMAQPSGHWNPNIAVPSSGPAYNNASNGMYMNNQMQQQQMHYPSGAPVGSMRGGHGNRGGSSRHSMGNSHAYSRMTPPLPETSPPHSPRKNMQLGMGLGGGSSMGMMKQCKFFLQGHCRMGGKCKFAHQAVSNQHHMPQHMGGPQMSNNGLNAGGVNVGMYQQPLQLSPQASRGLPHHQSMQGGDDHLHSFGRRNGYRQADMGNVSSLNTGSLNAVGSLGVSSAQSSGLGGISGSGLLTPSDPSGLSAALSVEDIQGRVFAMSKDQNGCRLLQEQLDYEDRKDLCEVIYQESLDHLAEMMVDPFGNYLFQKLLERVSEKKRLAIIRRVSSNLVAAALNLHGTRSVQKVVEVCATSAEVIEDGMYDDLDDDAGERRPNGVRRTVNLPDIIVEALKDDAVRLCIDSNGNHVIQRALQFMKPEYNQFVFDAVCKECTTVGTHRHGCCVLQRCLDAANKQQKAEVIAQVEKQAMKLMQDPYGNYVVQYVLDSCTAEEAYGVIVKPLGNIFELSIQKFSSNVIEKCLEKAPERVRQNYIKELINCPKMNKMLQDQFANYVVQRALCVCSEEQCLQLVKSIRPHLAMMKNTSGGRRITARILKRFPNMDISLDMGLSPTSDGMYDTNGNHMQLSHLPPPALGYGHHHMHASNGYPLAHPQMHAQQLPSHHGAAAMHSQQHMGYSQSNYNGSQHGGSMMNDGSGLGMNAAGTSRA
uniref:C3H1-type domain-containing protein n=1 Tax=Globisporangium ultimum (strain ATCC 200006 / CBS 805.95 / DAOM BR144) TaxID=431595 RepID=K3W6G7_GLOUD